jgi:hypothetical protein
MNQACSLSSWLSLAAYSDDPVRVVPHGRSWSVEVCKEGSSSARPLVLWPEKARGGRRSWASVGSVCEWLVRHDVPSFEVLNPNQSEMAL